MSAQFTVAQTVQSMIDCNAPMVFYYTHSKPELKRIVHPILIVNKHVVCVDSNTGEHKRFKLDGIKFHEKSLSDIIKINKPFTFTYSSWEPEKVRTVIPLDIKNGSLLASEENSLAWYLLEDIVPCEQVDENVIEEPKIVSKTHGWDCGFSWDYENDCCNCGDIGWTRCLYDDGHKEVLNNM